MPVHPSRSSAELQFLFYATQAKVELRHVAETLKTNNGMYQGMSEDCQLRNIKSRGMMAL